MTDERIEHTAAIPALRTMHSQVHKESQRGLLGAQAPSRTNLQSKNAQRTVEKGK